MKQQQRVEKGSKHEVVVVGSVWWGIVIVVARLDSDCMEAEGSGEGGGRLSLNSCKESPPLDWCRCLA